MRRPVRAATLPFLALVLAGCQADARDPAAEAADLLTGLYDNREQAFDDATYRALELSVVPIPGGGADGHWVYMEQSTTENAGRPFNQRVYRISNGAEGDVVAEQFAIPGAPRYARGWETGRLAELDPSKLQALPGCTLHLRATPDGWEGATRGNGCASNRSRETAYMQSSIAVLTNGLRTREAGFDAEGKELWGPADPYAFDRRGEIDVDAARRAQPARPSAPTTGTVDGVPGATTSPAPAGADSGGD